MDPKIQKGLEYIKKSKREGLGNAAIKKGLAQNNYSEKLIEETFNAYYSSKVISFSEIAIFVLLVITVLALIQPTIVGNLALSVEESAASSALVAIVFVSLLALFFIGIMKASYYESSDDIK